MPQTVKPRADIELDNFFAGVSEMRTYLDRHRQDPESRRARLAKLATELLRPRDGKALAESLTTQLAQALGAASAVLAVSSVTLPSAAASSWRVCYQIGTPRCAMALAEAANVSTSSQPLPLAPVSVDGALLIPLMGIDRIAGALWLEGCPPLDDASTQLVQAIADTAGVAIEQSLVMQTMA